MHTKYKGSLAVEFLCVCVCVCVCVCLIKMTAPAFVTFGTDERITYSTLPKGTENAKMEVILRQRVMGICIGLI